MKKFSYDNQINTIVSYLKNSEKIKTNFKIGFELEHIIVYQDNFKAVSYYEKDGVESTLKDLINKGWNEEYHNGHILEMHKGESHITLEPGSQLEISIDPQKKIEDLEHEYISFLKDLLPILEAKKQYLICIGYQPQSKIDDIKFIPKKRYEFMSQYLKKRGIYAHNMMKGTASLQVAVDFSCEEDYLKKFRCANALSPIVSCMFDNSPVFEGEIWNKNAVRTMVWNNCDDDRCNVIDGALSIDFGYENYAKYILNSPPIIVKEEKGFTYTYSTKLKDLFKDNTFDLNHIMTMYFPDVRTKNFIEIRMMDSLPYPLCFSAVALWKGLLYNENNLDKLYKYTLSIKDEDVKKYKEKIISEGIYAEIKGEKIINLMNKLLDMAEEGLCNSEKRYLQPIKEIIKQSKTPSIIIKEKLTEDRHFALKQNVLKIEKILIK